MEKWLISWGKIVSSISTSFTSTRKPAIYTIQPLQYEQEGTSRTEITSELRLLRLMGNYSWPAAVGRIDLSAEVQRMRYPALSGQPKSTLPFRQWRISNAWELLNGARKGSYKLLQICM
jgi:hypothetical protein